MFQIITDPKVADSIAGLIDYNTGSIRIWMRKLGWDKETRMAFWKQLADHESDDWDFTETVRERPRMPVIVTLESGNGLTYVPGLVQWTRPFDIDLTTGTFPFDFPINHAQVAEFSKAGYSMAILPNGTGFTFQTKHPEALRLSEELLVNVLESCFHLETHLRTEQEETDDRKSAAETDGERDGIEDAGVGSTIPPGCSS